MGKLLCIVLGLLLAVQIAGLLVAGYVLLVWFWESAQCWVAPSGFYLFRFFGSLTVAVSAGAARLYLARDEVA